MLSASYLMLLAIVAAEPQNLIRNPQFTEQAKPGRPADWQTSGDSKRVEQRLSVEPGREGRAAARLTCTRIEPGSSASHAMLCQMGVPLAQGAQYRVSFWAKADGLADGVVSVALSDTSDWTNLGLQDQFRVGGQWSQYEGVLVATRNAEKTVRFQIWFGSTGTLWIDDVRIERVVGSLYRPNHVIDSAGQANLVPNASFECGDDGWGSSEPERDGHWGGGLNHLIGQIDRRVAYDGQASLRIELGGQQTPVRYFDYFELQRQPTLAPLAANQGWIEVEPNRPYRLSVWMKAGADETPGLLAVREFGGRTQRTAVRITPQWHRYELGFKPASRWCYVMAGPDLRTTRETPQPPATATVWLDAVQLEAGAQATPFIPRSALELGLSTDRPGNVFSTDETAVISAHVQAADGQTPVSVEATVRDFFDRIVLRTTIPSQSPAPTKPAAARSYRLELPRQPNRLAGFLTLEVRAAQASQSDTRSLRLAIVPSAPRESRFGVNHAYPWPHLLDLCRKNGLLWVRDWSLKWSDIEPEPGRFDFAEADLQIDRPRRHGLSVLAMVPFPSSNWSSSAPASVPVSNAYPASRERIAFAPREAGGLSRFVEKTVAHYRDRIEWWQVFNESLYTSYSLPRKEGYDGKTYAGLTQAFVEGARRADPKCKILAGLGGLHQGQLMNEWEQFFAAGGAKGVDAIDIHHYPRLQAPEYIEPLLTDFRALMARHGQRQPIWLTEFGYYADDDLVTVPARFSGFDRPLPSERMQAAYAVRWSVIMLAAGVDKLFHHAGTCDSLDADSLQGVFFQYGGAPKRIYAAQAIMARWLTPATKFVKKVDCGAHGRAYLFAAGEQALAVAWTPEAFSAERLARDARVSAFDLMGRPIAEASLPLEETPIYLFADRVETLEAMLARPR